MQYDFPMTLSNLRKEHGISQKQAAADLGISQSLLSHYENGIRECGLGFLNRAADYYGVTTDHLLGRAQRNCSGSRGDNEQSAKFREEKRMLQSSLEVLLELLLRCENEEVTELALQICKLQIYYTVRIISCIYHYSSIPVKNGHTFFMDASEILRLSAELEQLSMKLDPPPSITEDELKQEFAELYTDLKLLVKNIGRNLL